MCGCDVYVLDFLFQTCRPSHLSLIKLSQYLTGHSAPLWQSHNTVRCATNSCLQQRGDVFQSLDTLISVSGEIVSEEGDNAV